MKALLDEQLSAQIAGRLREAGFDVVAVVERGELVGLSDRALFEVASSEGRAVITNNIKDFRPLAVQWLAQGRTHAGLILLPSARIRTRQSVAGLATAIAMVLRRHPVGIAGSERWIGPLPDS